MQTLIVVFCCVLACPLIMMGLMWWLERNPEEAEMRREERRLVKAKAKREAAELYHELLEHRWYQSEQASAEVRREDAVTSYVKVLHELPDERRAIVEP